MSEQSTIEHVVINAQESLQGEAMFVATSDLESLIAKYEALASERDALLEACEKIWHLIADYVEGEGAVVFDGGACLNILSVAIVKAKGERP